MSLRWHVYKTVSVSHHTCGGISRAFRLGSKDKHYIYFLIVAIIWFPNLSAVYETFILYFGGNGGGAPQRTIKLGKGGGGAHGVVVLRGVLRFANRACLLAWWHLGL